MEDVPAGNTYDKYGTRNPIARFLMYRFLTTFDRLHGMAAAGSALEVGCGEGHLSRRMARAGRQVRGIDLSSEIIATAQRLTPPDKNPPRFSVGSIYELSEELAAPLVVCCEVLEHLQDASRGLAALSRVTQRDLIVSVPCEPLWRILNVCRGRYLRDWGNTPGHVQHWTAAEFVKLISSQFDVVEVHAVLPWTMVLARRKSPIPSPMEAA